MVRLPRLLNSSLGEVGRLHPSKLSVKVNLTPLSTATMTLPEGEPTIGLRQWVEIYGATGSLGIFRVAAVKTDYGDGQIINLEHGIASLGDALTAEDTTLTGTPYAIMGTLLSYQALWQRGTVPNTGSYEIKVNRSNVLAAVLDLLKQMTGYGLTYDFTTAPWTLGIAALEAAPSCECRMSRNASGVRITLDDNDLCTRVYAVGLTNGYMDADTVGTWGVIAKALGTSDDADAEEVQAFAAQYLAEHKNPRVSIEVSAIDLAAQTGEPLDAFAVGKLCRVALPDWGYSTDQRLITVSYNNILGDPDDVQLSLSTAPRDLSHTLAAINSDLYGTSEVASVRGGGGRGGVSGKGKLIEYHSAILRNTNNVELLAWSQDELDASLASAMSLIQVNADNILLRVRKDGVISSINQTAESITISASKINLSGYVTASQLSAAFANLQSAYASLMTSENMAATWGEFGTLKATTLKIGSETIGKSSKSVLTDASLAVVKDSNGFVTAVSIVKYPSTISYLSH